MRTKVFSRMSLFLLAGLLISTPYSLSQDGKPSRQEKKEARKYQLAANYAILDTLLTNRIFVLEADYLRTKYGDKIPVSSNINFIKVSESTGVLQTGSVFSMGYNGVGGVTAEGEIGQWDIHKDPKRLHYILRFTINSNIGHYDVLLRVGADTRAEATITGLGPGNLTWEGYLVTLGNSRVFKGRNFI